MPLSYAFRESTLELAVHLEGSLRTFVSVLVSISFCGSAALADADPALPQARAIYRRLTNELLRAGSPDEQAMLGFVRAGDLAGAARYATQKDSFIDSVVRSWSTELLTNAPGTNLPLNDSLAYVIGSVRDNLDARELLTGNYLYAADPRFGLGHPSLSSNTVFDSLEKQGKSLRVSLAKVTPQWFTNRPDQTAGLLTTRYWASVNYSAGTNRRVIPALFNSFLCQGPESWRRPNLPTSVIRQDVDRFPGGDARVFQTECRSCHSVMDGLSGAFSAIDYSANTLTFSDSVLAKYLRNSTTYPDGKVTKDQSFVNFLTNDPSNVYGWKDSSSPANGNGLGEFGAMIANADLYPRCLARRAIRTVCHQDVTVTDPFAVSLAERFKQDGYGLRDLFVEAVTSPQCLSAEVQ
jgi:hypothetical protein